MVGAILTVFGLLGSIVSAPIRQWNARRSAGAVSMEDQLDKGNTVYADVQFVTTGNRNHDLMPTCGGQGLIRVTVSEPVRYVFEYRDREAVKIVCPRGTPRLKAMTAIGIVIDEGRNRGELVKMEFRYNVAAYRGGN